MARRRRRTTALWLAYDLGRQGNHQALYAWLDAHHAQECGGRAAFVPSYEHRGDLLVALRRDLGHAVRTGRCGRIYVVYPTRAGKLQGRFLFGKHARAPWAGHGEPRDGAAPEVARSPGGCGPEAAPWPPAATAAASCFEDTSSTALPIDIDTVDLREHALIKFYARAHSVDAALAGWRLALWCPARPSALPRALPCPQRLDAPAEDMAVFAWRHERRSRRVQRVHLPVREVIAHAALLEPGQRVVLARRELPPEVFRLLRERLGYAPDMAGQILGWWYGEDDELPEEPPPWGHTGSLLPEGGGALREGARCLVLVEVDDCWYVLSERALRTYAFSSRLADGVPLQFVRSTGAGMEHWWTTPAARISQSEVEARFGPEVARRARRDAAAVMVRVRRRE